MILKTGGILRVNDHPNGECRRPEPAADGSPAGNQPGGAVRRKREKGDLRVGGTGAGAARVRDAREKDAGGGAGIPGEDDGEVAAADHPSGATVPGDGAGAGADLPATRRILEREGEEYGHQEYARLTQISVGHLYNLRKRPDYRKQVAFYEATRPAKISIAERRRPDPQGRPGYLRVDTVHQGDWDGHKGVYHINSVDAVTQWEVVGYVPIISAESPELLLEVLMAQHPVPIRGFHVDNGSDYSKHVMAKLLGDSLVEFTKSRAYQSSDNALVEGKNGAIIRKHMG